MLYTGGPFGMASRGQRSVSIDTEDVDIPQETKTAVTPVSSFLGIQDRSRWPDDALKRLAKGVDQELDRRAQETGSTDEELAALEQRLKWEAQRYERG